MVEGVPLPSRMGRLRLPTLCLITDRHRCGATELEAVVKAAIEGGVNVVQLREKDLPAGELFSLGIRLREVTRGKALFLMPKEFPTKSFGFSTKAIRQVMFRKLRKSRISWNGFS